MLSSAGRPICKGDILLYRQPDTPLLPALALMYTTLHTGQPQSKNHRRYFAEADNHLK
jgi:hypothetical protein